MKKILLLLSILGALLYCPLPTQAAEGKTTINFSVAVDESATVDRLVSHALKRIDGYDMGVEVFPMSYAIQMANSGEKDALVAQISGLEAKYPNLVMVPEQISEIRFDVYTKKGCDKKIDDWEDLAGLRVGSLMHKTHMEERLPPDIKEHIYRDSNTELIQALLAGECDVFVATATLNDALQIPDSIAFAGEIEHLPTYIYLNKRYAALVPELARAISDIKSDGTYQKIIDHEKTNAFQQKKVLHISSYYADDPWEQELLEGISGVLSADDNIQYENIALNANRSLNESNRFRTISSMVRTSYLNDSPDVVIASDNAAIQFVIDYYNILFFDTPIIFCGQTGMIDDQLWKFSGNGTGIYEAIPTAENISLILDLFPDTEHLFILNGYSASGVAWRREIEKQLEAMPEAAELDIIFSPKAPLSEILEAINALPTNSAVLCGTYTLDGNNQCYSQKEVQLALSGGCNLPVFGMRCGSIGYGTIGGKYVEPAFQGKTAAEYALAVLRGQDVRSIPPLRDTQSFNSWTFDHNALERFDIDESRLPPGSNVINKRLTMYESNPKAFVLTVLLFLLALLVIVILGALVTTIRNRNKRLLEVQKSLHSTEELLEKDKEIVAIAQRLEIALAASESGAWEINARTGMFYFDHTIAGALGLSTGGCIPIEQMNEILSRLQDGFAGSDHQRALLCVDLEAFSRLNPPELAFTTPDGSKRYYHNCTKVMKDDNGQVDCLIGLLLDVTSHVHIQQELRDAKDAAESANRAKSQFLSNMSHEIRTPMNAIIGMTDLLASEPLSGKQMQFVQDINTSAAWLLEIINDLLDLSKIESGKLVLVPVSYSLNELLDNINSMFAYSASQKNISYTCNYSENLPEFVFGDDVRVRQILVNVISNAVKYTQKGGVELEVRCDGCNLQYTVIDTGVGITRENLPFVFDDYAQFDLRHNRGASGTGLGLAITKRLVDRMGGSIQISSVYGEGTRVDITLPYAAGDAGDAGGQSVESRTLCAPGAQILVVDDKEINLRVAAGLLERFAISCHTALSGAEAIEKIRNTRYDLVFMDQMMPDMDGIETLRRLRAEGFTSDVLPVVALTANAVSNTKAMLLSAGMDDFLPKPINKSELECILQKWLPPSLVHFHEADGVEAKEPALSPFLAEAAKIEGLDITHGLLIIDGDQDAYQELLRLAMRTLPDNADVMSRCLAAGEMDRLGIEAHGVKSALSHIGALTLAAQALGIEEHARSGDTSFCSERLPSLLDGMKALQEELHNLFGWFSGTDVRMPGDSASLVPSLAVLRGYIDCFEYDAAKHVLAQLSMLDFGEEINAMVTRTDNMVDVFDFSAAAMLLDEIVKTHERNCQ